MASYCTSCEELADIKRIREVGDGDGELELTSDHSQLRNTRPRVTLDPWPSSARVDKEENSESDLSPLHSSNTFADELEDNEAISDAEGQLEVVQAETTTFDGGSTERSNIVLAEGPGSVVSTEVRRPAEVIERTVAEADLDEFFTAFEQKQQKSFSEKYNFDVKKGVPMKGRFEWVPIDHEWT